MANLPVPKEIPNKNILIEGIDGSGKDTFAEMLLGYLKMVSIKSATKSISLVGLPSSHAIYGMQCKKFIEDADVSTNYNDMKRMLKCKNVLLAFLTVFSLFSVPISGEETPLPPEIF